MCWLREGWTTAVEDRPNFFALTSLDKERCSSACFDRTDFDAF